MTRLREMTCWHDDDDADEIEANVRAVHALIRLGVAIVIACLAVGAGAWGYLAGWGW